MKRTERGWLSHCCVGNKCQFRRNTLIEYGGIKIIVGTIGLYMIKGETKQIGSDRYYETMAFHSDNTKYNDVDVSRQIDFDSQWSINKKYVDIEANDMHENVVKEIMHKLQKGYNFS